MANTIKRNKKVFDYLNSQLDRLGINLVQYIDTYIVPNVSSSDLLQIREESNLLKSSILNNDDVLIQVLKSIGVMEVSENKKEFEELNKKKIKKQELTDFDKILKGILKVSNKEEKEKR